MQPIKTVIFDLGGVLIDWNPDYVFTQIYPDQSERQWFYDNVCTSSWNLQQDAGRSLAEATEEKVAEWPDYEPQIRAYYGRWKEMLGGSVDESVEVLRQLRDKGDVQLVALTNWSHETFPVALDRFDFLGWFEGIVVSGTEKTIKPLRDIYEIAINRYSIPREHAIFIDDNKENVEGAKAVGLQGLWFQNPGQLRHDLAELGLL